MVDGGFVERGPVRFFPRAAPGPEVEAQLIEIRPAFERYANDVHALRAGAVQETSGILATEEGPGRLVENEEMLALTIDQLMRPLGVHAEGRSPRSGKLDEWRVIVTLTGLHSGHAQREVWVTLAFGNRSSRSGRSENAGAQSGNQGGDESCCIPRRLRKVWLNRFGANPALR